MSRQKNESTHNRYFIQSVKGERETQFGYTSKCFTLFL